MDDEGNRSRTEIQRSTTDIPHVPTRGQGGVSTPKIGTYTTVDRSDGSLNPISFRYQVKKLRYEFVN